MLWKLGFEDAALGPDLHDERATGLEMRRCARQDATHEVEPIFRPGMCDCRLGSMLQQKQSHLSSGDVRRVGDDEVVAAASQPVEQIAGDSSILWPSP